MTNVLVCEAVSAIIAWAGFIFDFFLHKETIGSILMVIGLIGVFVFFILLADKHAFSVFHENDKDY